MKITNKRKTPIYFRGQEIAAQSFISPSLNAPMDFIVLSDSNKFFDMELPTDGDLDVYNDKVVFDDIEFKLKKSCKWYILLLFIACCVAIYFIPVDILWK